MKRFLAFFACIVAALTAFAIRAQAPSSTASASPTISPWPPPGRTDPTRLPGDVTAPPVSEMIRPPGGGGGPFPVFPKDAPGVPMEVAVEAVQAAVAACRADGLVVAAVVTDSAGVLRVGISADGASPPGRVYGAVPKAVAAVAFKEPTSVIREQVRANPSLAPEVKPNMVILPGGVPIIAGGKVMGAIAVSGANAAQDEVCANAGLGKIRGKLR